MYLPLAILLVVHRGPNCTPFYNLPPASGLRTAVRCLSSRGSPTRDSALALSSRVGCVLACRVSIRYIPHRTRYSIYLCRDVQLWSLSNSALRTHKTPYAHDGATPEAARRLRISTSGVRGGSGQTRRITSRQRKADAPVRDPLPSPARGRIAHGAPTYGIGRAHQERTVLWTTIYTWAHRGLFMGTIERHTGHGDNAVESNALPLTLAR